MSNSRQVQLSELTREYEEIISSSTSFPDKIDQVHSFAENVQQVFAFDLSLSSQIKALHTLRKSSQSNNKEALQTACDSLLKLCSELLNIKATPSQIKQEVKSAPQQNNPPKRNILDRVCGAILSGIVGGVLGAVVGILGSIFFGTRVLGVPGFFLGLFIGSGVGLVTGAIGLRSGIIKGGTLGVVEGVKATYGGIIETIKGIDKSIDKSQNQRRRRQQAELARTNSSAPNVNNAGPQATAPTSTAQITASGIKQNTPQAQNAAGDYQQSPAVESHPQTGFPMPTPSAPPLSPSRNARAFLPSAPSQADVGVDVKPPRI